ncbi:MAG: hypothetical protein AAF988_08695 [Pseudomonadota bacterium]
MSVDKRRKLYSLTLLGCLLAITIIGLANIWSPNLFNSTLYNVAATLVIGMGLSGMLYTLSFKDEGEKTESSLVKVIGGIAVGLSALFIVQIWFDALNGLLFGKITATGIIVAIVAGFVITLKDDFFENKRLKDENCLD